MFNLKKKEIATRSPLGTATVLEGETADYSPKVIKKSLKENKVAAIENVKVVNPVTGKKAVVTIERDGTPDSKLVMALADKKMNRDQKDNVLSLYLFERGKENASFLMDLMRYKGSHTKETQAFKSQVRFDFEMFVGLFTKHLDQVAKDIFKELEIIDYRAFLEGYVKYLKEAKEEGNMRDFGATEGFRWGITEATLAVLAVRNIEEADQLREAVKKVTENRMKDKGYGIYISKDGRSYSVIDDDVDEVVKKDRERINELNQHE